MVLNIYEKVKKVWNENRGEFERRTGEWAENLETNSVRANRLKFRAWKPLKVYVSYTSAKKGEFSIRYCGQINTAYIERDNLTLRQELHRLTRKTLGFSKNLRELQHALDFIEAHDNFIKPHRSLRQKALCKGNPVWIPRTPAMAAGISRHIWTLEELLCHKT